MGTRLKPPHNEDRRPIAGEQVKVGTQRNRVDGLEHLIQR